MNNKTFTSQELLNEYNNNYSKCTSNVSHNTVKRFLKLYGHMYPDDLKKTLDFLHDYVLLQQGLY